MRRINDGLVFFEYHIWRSPVHESMHGAAAVHGTPLVTGSSQSPINEGIELCSIALNGDGWGNIPIEQFIVIQVTLL